MAVEKLSIRRRRLSVRVEGKRVVLSMGGKGRYLLTGAQAVLLSQALQRGAAQVALDVARTVTVGEIFDVISAEISKRKNRP